MGDVIYIRDRLAEQDRHPGATGGSPAAASAGSAAIQVADLRARTAVTASRRTTTRHLPPSPVGSQSTAFFFELSSPLSYLAAERVERMLGDVTWVPAMPSDLRPGAGLDGDSSIVEAAEREAALLRLPLVIPDGHPLAVRKATRAAAYAAANGSGARFALAAFRLAFCGGFDLDRSSVLAEAAAAAGFQRQDILRAASDPRWDIQPTGTARGLAGHGVLSMPAIRVASRWFEGIDAVGEASLYTTFRGAHGAAGV